MEFLIWDAMVILIIALCILSHAKKGFVSTIILFIICIVSMILAYFTADYSAEKIYDSGLKNSVISSLKDTLGDYSISDDIKDYYHKKTVGLDLTDRQVDDIINSGDDMNKKLSDIINTETGEDVCSEDDAVDGLYGIINDSFENKISEKLPPCAGKYFDSLLSGNSEKMFSLITIIANNDKTQAAEYIEENYIGNLIIRLIKVIEFVILSIFFITVAKIIFGIIKKQSVMQAADKADAVAGGILGFVIGLVTITVFAFMVKMIIYTGLSVSFFSDSTINDSWLFKYFYKIDTILIK